MKAVALFALASCGCAVMTQIAAEPEDLADYRAYRAAAHEGRRLALAQQYLRAHPDGAWAEDVRASFVAEEAAYYEAAQQSRRRAFEYLVDLPTGPHAAAARALLAAFDEHFERRAVEQLVRDAQRTEAMLDRAREARSRVADHVAAELRALLDANVYGVRTADAPAPLRFALSGMARPTLGWVPTRREDTFFFTLPTPSGKEMRAADVVLEVLQRGGVIVEGRVSGSDLFARWTEAETNAPLDATDPAARAKASAHVAARLSGIMESLLPAERCTPLESADELFVRRCDGWVAAAWMGQRAGERDVIAIRGARRDAPDAPNPPGVPSGVRPAR